MAKYLLEFERGTFCAAPKLRQNLEQARHSAQFETNAEGVRLLDDRLFRRKLARKQIDVDILEFNEQQIITLVAEGQSPGLLASVVKVMGMELVQNVDVLATEAAGLGSLVLQPEALVPGNTVEAIGPDYALTPMPRYLDNRAVTIAGGTSEVLRGIIAKSVLGL